MKTSRADLPDQLPLFPLPGALLLPGGELPLNIFEPRYLRMVEAALSEPRLIGVIQPAPSRITPQRPELAAVGCAGRISGFQETGDGRYLIVLSGVCRFRIVDETTTGTSYRTAHIDWSPYHADLTEHTLDNHVDTFELANALRDYLSRNGLTSDMTAISDTPVQTLINSISVDCPFTNSEKQALLEARTLKDRCAALVALLSMSGLGQQAGQQKEYVQ